MTQHSDEIRLWHMREAADEAVEFARGKQRSDLDADRLLRHGLTRVLEIIGEAAGRVSQETRERHPAIPWKQVTRNLSGVGKGIL